MARVTNHSRSLNFKNKRKNLNFRPKSANLHSLNNPLSNKTQIKKRINCLKALEMKNLETLQVVSTISLGTNPWKGKAEIRAIMKNSQKSTSMIIRLQLLQELKITPLKSMLKRRKPSQNVQKVVEENLKRMLWQNTLLCARRFSLIKERNSIASNIDQLTRNRQNLSNKRKLKKRKIKFNSKPRSQPPKKKRTGKPKVKLLDNKLNSKFLRNPKRKLKEARYKLSQNPPNQRNLEIIYICQLIFVLSGLSLLPSFLS